jgi:hypothetical protein
MTSLCNYSHPEQQITGGLARHGSGSLFPYNPEFYKLASGLYGPGSIYCWHLLLASVIINWFFRPVGDDGYRRPGISNDLLGGVAYPVFAATDVLVHAMKMLGMKYRALAIFCLQFPETDLAMLANFNHTQLDLRSIPPDVLSLGQHVIDITGPVTVCYRFTTVIFIWFVSIGLGLGHYLRLRPTTWAISLIYVSYGYAILVLMIFHLSLGDLSISFFLGFYEAILLPILIIEWALAVLISYACVVEIFNCIKFLLKKDRAQSLEALKTLAGFMLLWVITFPAMYLSRNSVRLVPDLGIRVTERDQLATLIVGIATLCFTLQELLRRKELESTSGESEQEELQTLSGDA